MGTKFKKNQTRPEEAKYWWAGSVSSVTRGDAPTEVKRAYQSWIDQRSRCSNPKQDSYKYYGAKGVKVLYGSREFVGWWLEEQGRLGLKKPTISRIDHDGNYEFGNIKLEEHIDNCVWDMLRRHGAPSLKTCIPVVCFDYGTMEPLMIFKSSADAQKYTEVASSNIRLMCLRPDKHKFGKGFSFRYLSEYPQWEDGPE